MFCLLSQCPDVASDLERVLSLITDQFGDNKEPLRLQAQKVVVDLSTKVGPQAVVDQLQVRVLRFLLMVVPAALNGSQGLKSHRNWRVKEQYARCLSALIDLHGSTGFSVDGILTQVSTRHNADGPFNALHTGCQALNLLEDSNPPVRDAALDLVVSLHSVMGSRVRVSLSCRMASILPGFSIQL